MSSPGSDLEITLEGGAPWGFRLQGGSDFGAPLQIARVAPAGKAQIMGLKEGDYLLAINNSSCVNASHNDALRLVKSAQGILALSILRGKPPERKDPVRDTKVTTSTTSAAVNSTRAATSSASSNGPGTSRSDRGSLTSPPSAKQDVRLPVVSTRLSFSFSPTHSHPPPGSEGTTAPEPSDAKPRQEGVDGRQQTSSSALPELPTDAVSPTSSLSFDRPAAPGRGAKRLTSEDSSTNDNGPSDPLSPGIPEQGGAKNKSWYKQMFKNMHATGDTHFTPTPSNIPTSATTAPQSQPSGLKKSADTNKAPSGGQRSMRTASLPRSVPASSADPRRFSDTASWRTTGGTQPRSVPDTDWYKQMQGGKSGVSSTKTAPFSAKTTPASNGPSSVSPTSSFSSRGPNARSSRSSSESVSALSPVEKQPPLTKEAAPADQTSTSTEGYSSLNNALSDLNDAITSLQHATEEAAMRQSKKHPPWQPPSAKKEQAIAPVADRNWQVHKKINSPPEEPLKQQRQQQQRSSPDATFDWQKLMASAPVDKSPPSETSVRQAEPVKPTVSKSAATKPARPKSTSSITQQTSAERVKVIEEPVQAVRQTEDFAPMTDQLQQLLANLDQPSPRKPLPSSQVPAQTTEDIRASPKKSFSADLQATSVEPVEVDSAYQWQSNHQTPYKQPSPEPAVAKVPSPEPVVAKVPSPKPAVAQVPSPEPIVAKVPSPAPVVAKVPSPEPAVAQVPSPEPIVAKVPSPELAVAKEPSLEPVFAKEPSPEPVFTKEHSPEPIFAMEPSPEPVVAQEPTPEPVAAKEPSPEPVVDMEPSPEPVQASLGQIASRWSRQWSPDQEAVAPTKPSRERTPDAVTTNHDTNQQTPSSSDSPDIQALPELKPGQGLARSLYAFEAQSKRELTFSKGKHIVLLRRVDANWLEGEWNGQKGIFPAAYVDVITDVERKSRTPTPAKTPETSSVKSTSLTRSDRSSSSSATSTGPRHPTSPPPSEPPNARARYSFHAESARELKLVKGDIVTLLKKVDNNWFEGQLRGVKGIFPVSYVEVLNPLPETSSKAARQKSSSQEGTGTAEKKKGPGRPTDAPKLASPTSPLSPASVGSPSGRHGQPYRALYNYAPKNVDELELRENDEVDVVEQCDDGWFVGTSMRTNVFGTFPGNYVEAIKF